MRAMIFAIAIIIAAPFAQAAQSQTYAVIDAQGRVVNLIRWDGDTSIWSPTAAYGAGYSVRLATANDQIWQGDDTAAIR